MKSADYWKKRSEQIAARQFAKADIYEAELKREYVKAINEIRRSVDVFYRRYAINGEVSMADARKQLSGSELREFKMTLEEFTAKAKDNADGRWTKQLNAIYYRTRVSRYEALQVEIRQQAEMLAGSKQTQTAALLSDIYEDTYYRTIFEIHKGIGIGGSFARVNQEGLQKVLGTEFAGSNWSKRIWGDKDKLVSELQTKLAQSFIRGDSIERTINDLIGRMDVSRSNAERLVQTESAFFAGNATAEGYKESGVVDRYEILATLDSRTSAICQSMDGEVIPLSEREVSINYPPFHARCRTTTIPFFDDDDVGERAARGKDGNTYYVPSGMKYGDWKEKYVNEHGQDHWDIQQKMVKNESSDREQYKRYKETLGADAPKSFAAFQSLKYTDSEAWNRANNDYRKLNAYDKIIANEPKITADLQSISKITGTELVGLDYRLKSKESYLRKVNSDSKNSLDSKMITDIISNTNDVIRYTYQTEGHKLTDAYTKITGEMDSKGYSGLKIKNTWNDKRNPYRGVNGIFVSPDGQKFEVQFHTPESFELKNGKMHKLYEEYRLDNTTIERRSEITTEMFTLSSILKKPNDIDKIN